MSMKLNRAYIEEYRCGCSSVERYKKNFLGYCKTHGEDKIHIHTLFYISDEELKELQKED